jgi:hypothetical protein
MIRLESLWKTSYPLSRQMPPRSTPCVIEMTSFPGYCFRLSIGRIRLDRTRFESKFAIVMPGGLVSATTNAGQKTPISVFSRIAA